MASFFCFLLGWIFFNLLVTYLESVHNHMVNQSGISFTLGVIRPFFYNMNFLFLFMTPVITMNSLGGQRQRGSFDLLWATPLREWEFLVGKWIASVLSLSAFLVLSLSIPLILLGANLPLGGLLSGYLALFLNLSFYISVGVFISTFTSSQAVSALATLVVILFFWMIPWASQSSYQLILIEIYRYLGVMTHFTGVLEGKISTSNLCYYLSFEGLLFLLSFFWLSRRKESVS